VDGDHEFELAARPAQHLCHLGIQVEQRSDVIELALSHLKGINWFYHVWFSLFIDFNVVFIYFENISGQPRTGARLLVCLSRGDVSQLAHLDGLMDCAQICLTIANVWRSVK
jgi:hypothetical protein